MRIIKETNINFIGNKRYFYTGSALYMLATIIALVLRGGPNWGIDFVGGTMVELKYEKAIVQDLQRIRTVVGDLKYGDAEVKTVGRESDNQIQITVKRTMEGTLVSDEITSSLKKQMPDNPFTLMRQEKVGPKIGGELKWAAIWSLILGWGAIIVYVGLRFKLPFGVAGVVALVHDVLVAVGFFAFINAEISLPIIAALLTIVGYSINDTIVIFDRIRENLGTSTVRKSFEDRCNEAINQTLSRTIITTLTVMLTLIVIYAFFFNTEDVIKYFALAMIVGCTSGTYSTVGIATNIVVDWHRRWPIKS